MYDKVIDENIQYEMSFSEKCTRTLKKLISICCDCRWGSRGSGRKYGSTDGCYVAIGNYTSCVLGAISMSTLCTLCQQGVEHDKAICSKTGEYHSKAMEGAGCKQFVHDLIHNYNVFLRELVADDDSSIRKVCKHSFKKMIEVGWITKEQHPKTPSGKPIADNGKLPLWHIPIHTLSDRAHRVRGTAAKLFALCAKKNEICIGNTHDAERMKRNLSYATRMYCCDSLENLTKAVKNVVPHHFNIHENCGDWCQCVGKKPEEMEKL